MVTLLLLTSCRTLVQQVGGGCGAQHQHDHVFSPWNEDVDPEVLHAAERLTSQAEGHNRISHDLGTAALKAPPTLT